MTEPRLRITCPIHPGRTIGYVLIAPGSGLVCQTQVPLSPKEHDDLMDRYAPAKRQGRPIPRALVGSRVLRLLLDDPGEPEGIPAWCPDCRSERFLELTWLRAILASGVPSAAHAVLSSKPSE